MENVLNYYEFSDFFNDKSETFSGNEISYTAINDTHFLIFEKNGTQYNLYITKYESTKDIGNKPPLIVETLVKDYNKSNPEHRKAIKQYLY